MKEQLATLGITVLTAILPILGLVLTWAGIQLQSWIRLKVNNERLEGVLLRLEEAVEGAIKEVHQTVLSALDAPTKENLAEARQMALASIRSHLGPRGLKELMHVLGLDDGVSVERLLVTKLESKVHDLKKSGQLQNNHRGVT